MFISSYLKSVFQKLDLFLFNQSISALLFLRDQDHQRLEDVIFLQANNEHVTGLFIDGVNPYFTSYLPDQRDDFNLFAIYEKLSIEIVQHSFRIETIYSFHNRFYNEHLGVYLSNQQEQKSIFIIFMQDEFYIENDLSYEKCKEIMSQKLKHIPQENICCYHRNIVSDHWIETKD